MSYLTTLKSGQKKLAMVEETEVAHLADRFGEPVRRHFDIPVDEYMKAVRWREDSDRRAEVVFAIQQTDGTVLLHTKRWYQPTFYRIFSGGIECDELVEDALHREIHEETGLTVSVERFLGLLTYTFWDGASRADFASYVFHLNSQGETPTCNDPWEVAGYSTVPPEQLPAVSRTLRGLKGKRTVWGQWRSLSHDLVYEGLMGKL